METHFGKLRRVHVPENHSIEDWCREKCQDAGITEIASYNDSWLEELQDRFGRKFFVVDGEVWEAIEHTKSDSDCDIDIMIPNPDLTVTFIQQFYNGGTCLPEVIENGIRNLKKQNKLP